jgi:hypothetical protein
LLSFTRDKTEMKSKDNDFIKANVKEVRPLLFPLLPA